MRKEFKSRLSLFILILVLAEIANVNGQTLNNNKSAQKQENKQEPVMYSPPRENLKLSFKDTIINAKTYYFSTPNSKDIFRLIVRPGSVKNSKSEFQIKSSDGKIIYSKIFDSYVLVMRIFDTVEIPKDRDYETYLADYSKSLTNEQYQTFFNKSVRNIFDNISFMDKMKFQELLKVGNVIDKDALNESLANNKPRLIHLNCFYCDTGGGSVLYYSKKKSKAIEIVGHD